MLLVTQESLDSTGSQEVHWVLLLLQQNDHFVSMFDYEVLIDSSNIGICCQGH